MSAVERHCQNYAPKIVQAVLVVRCLFVNFPLKYKTFSVILIYFSVMEGFDDPGVFFSDNFGVEENESQDQINLQAVKKKFKEFIRQFHTGNFNYKYR